MKVVLSRKGFDSSNGGIVSPIFEDGAMVSFPIPSSDKDVYSEFHYNGIPYTKILSDLNYKGKQHCHADPDLDQSRRCVKVDTWEPVFGQIDASATYLKNIGIEKGDLFLFFGNFHRVRNIYGVFQYERKTGDFYRDNDLQVIWGYLQVGEIVEEPEEQERLWWHPHSTERRRNNRTNVIYKAAEELSFDENKPRAGLLSFDVKRVLTHEHCNKATWKMNSVYDTDHVLCRRRNSAKDPSVGIYYAGIWQELGLVESEECIQWAQSIVI